MRALQHTQRMLQWWAQAGLARADLAVHRSTGAMLWHHDLPLAQLPLSWARAENLRGSDIYIRPSRGYDWPIVFLDDVPTRLALSIARHYTTLLIHTSQEGGFHLWIRCAHPLSELARCQAQRWLSAKTGSDPASTSGEHLGRLAGVRNFKRDGQWVNLVATSTVLPTWTPNPHIWQASADKPNRRLALPVSDPLLACPSSVDLSPSGQEWGWVCGALQAGLSPQSVYAALLKRCAQRRGPGAERYARLTLSNAMRNRSGTATQPLGPDHGASP